MDMLKKLDKKFLITCGCLIIIPLLIILILMVIRGCSNSITSYEKYQDNMVKSAEHYFKYHKLMPKVEGKEVIVTLDELVLDGFKSPEKAVKDSTCTGSVTVKKNGKYYNYIPYLECNDYTTDYIINHLKKDIVSKESGLYKINDEFIYKGNKVNNYVSFYGTLFRIMKIDSKGNLLMIKQHREDDQIPWDTKYNVDVNDNIGINDYYNSSIYDELWKNYNDEKKVTVQMRKKMIAFDVCLDKKTQDDLVLEHNKCDNVLENQFISLPTIYDYSLASYDNNCNEVGAGACGNYNYLYEVITSSWTINTSSDDTYSIYYLAGSEVLLQSADNYKSYYWVISISGNEMFIKGNGSANNPYVIQ